MLKEWPRVPRRRALASLPRNCAGPQFLIDQVSSACWTSFSKVQPRISRLIRVHWRFSTDQTTSTFILRQIILQFTAIHSENFPPRKKYCWQLTRRTSSCHHCVRPLPITIQTPHWTQTQNRGGYVPTALAISELFHSSRLHEFRASITRMSGYPKHGVDC